MNYNNQGVRFCFFVLMLFQHVHSAPPIITRQEERDLELFESLNKSDRGIVAFFDRTHTQSGKACLVHHLKNPTTDVALVQLRQEQIKLLLKNPALLEEVKGLLARVKAAEPDLLYFINHEEDPVARTMINTFYFKNAWLKDFNKSSVALDARNYLKQLGLLSPVVEHLIFHFALSHIQEKLTHAADHDRHGHHHHHGHGCIHDHLEAPAGSSALVETAFGALKAAHLGIHLMSFKDIVEQMGTERTMVNQLYKKVASVKDGLQAMHALHACLKEHGYTQRAFSYQGVVSGQELQHGIKLFDQLLTDSYFDTTSSLGYVSPIGNTLYQYQQLKKYDSSLQVCMERVGDIDVLVSIADWYQEQEAKKAPVCFVDFVSSTTPVITFKDMWHVALNPEDAIMNDIHLGADAGAYKFIITGPNKAGKSTIIKAVGLNIILAQAFGIAAASKAELTPFYKVLSYMTITDDLAHDRSTFVAELIRAEECVQALQALQPGQYACLLIDDALFKGTNVEKSEDMALRFVDTLGTYGNSCALIATHCKALTQLACEKPTIFKNYRIKMDTDNDGNVRSTFTLEDGVADQAAAFDIIKREQSISF